ncbi:MAG TPA: glycosyltransferase family 4 protein [Burkholderiaceae bacterium]|nr:glycosyltransferase family 4 protein [Burkholderiaceae bacterium]
MASNNPAPHASSENTGRCVLVVVNNPAFFLSHRLALAEGARDRGHEVHIATMDGPAVEEIRRLGFTHHVLQMSRSGKNPLQELRTLAGLWRLFRRVRPDLVHAVTIKAVIYGGMAARLARVPALVAAISGLGYLFTRPSKRFDITRWAATQLYRLALGHPHSRVIFQNTDDRDTLESLRVVTPDQSVLVRGSGVDLSAYTAVSEPGEPPCVVVCVARLLRDKGIHEFIEAAKCSREAGDPITWQLAGAPDPGNPTSLGQGQVQQWHDEGVITWLGERDDVARLYQQAHVAVLPSYREGLPKSLIEAAACGRAIVTTDVPGCRDAVVPGVTGVLVPPQDARALLEAVRSLAADPAARQAMGRAGRELAEREFGIEQIVNEQLAIYDELLVPVATPR